MRRAFGILTLLVAAGLALDAEAQNDEKQSTRPSLSIGGFSDINFSSTDEQGVDSNSGFTEGQFVLHFVSTLSDRVSFFAEVSLRALSSEFRTELERGIIKYSHSDYLKLSFGRFHTPINWWNTAFHHGQWLQTTVARPDVTAFGGEFIPVHFVGGMAEGAIPSGNVNLSYKVGIGNGRSEIISRGGDAGDVNNSRAWLVNLSGKPSNPFGLEFGGAFYRDKISPAVGEEFRESITSVYVVWTRETPEVIAEYARTDRDGVTTSQSFESDAYYIQVAYRLGHWKSRLKPYARYEKIDLAAGEPVFGALTDREGSIVGIRIDTGAFLALKVEFRHQRSNLDPYVDGVFVQGSYAF